MKPQQLFKDLRENFSDIEFSGMMVNDELKYHELEKGLDQDEYEALVSRLYFIAIDPSKNIRFFITQYREGRYLYFLKVSDDLWMFILCRNESFAKLHFYIQFLLTDASIEIEDELPEEQYTEVKEINSARRIQELMFPDMQSAMSSFRDYHFWYQPKDMVGGDFYWVKKLKGETWAVIGDCTGHGMEGALSSVSIMSILNQVFERGISPHMLIKEVHRGLNDMQKQDLTHGYGIGCEMMVMHFNHKTKELKYSGTGLPLYHLSDNKIYPFKTKNAGFMPERVVKYVRSRKLQLKHGDGVLTHSDGLVDQMNEKGKRLMKRKFVKALRAQGTVNDKVTRELVTSHQGMEPQTDDIISFYVKI